MRIRLVLFAGALALLIPTATLAGVRERPPQLPPQYIRGKIMSLQIDISFKADPNFSYGDRLVGDEIMSRHPPQYVLFVGDDLNMPLDKCRRVYVELSVFLRAKVGDKYQPQVQMAGRTNPSADKTSPK